MADDGGLGSVLQLIATHPEKGALLLVVLAGAWRWIRELFRENKDDSRHDTVMDRLLKNDAMLREENASLRDENERLRRELRSGRRE